MRSIEHVHGGGPYDIEPVLVCSTCIKDYEKGVIQTVNFRKVNLRYRS